MKGSLQRRKNKKAYVQELDVKVFNLILYKL